jgi:hypothetical protein
MKHGLNTDQTRMNAETTNDFNPCSIRASSVARSLSEIATWAPQLAHALSPCILSVRHKLEVPRRRTVHTCLFDDLANRIWQQSNEIHRRHSRFAYLGGSQIAGVAMQIGAQLCGRVGR